MNYLIEDVPASGAGEPCDYGAAKNNLLILK